MTVWQPGMRCVCIGGPIVQGHRNDTEPTVGNVYTVREIEDRGNGVALRLQEIHNPKRLFPEGYGERAFWHSRFRPLSETRLDQFRKYLKRIPADRVPA